MKYKIGDIVECLSDRSNKGRSVDVRYGGHGYKAGLRGKIIQITSIEDDRPVVWLDKQKGYNGSGIYIDAIKKVEPKIYKIY